MCDHGLNSDRRLHVTLSTLQFDDFFNYYVQNPHMVLVSPIKEFFGLVSMGHKLVQLFGVELLIF
jgi:hypothetical protein